MRPDVLLENGVAHIIDRVLLVESVDTSAASDAYVPINLRCHFSLANVHMHTATNLPPPRPQSARPRLDP